VRSHCRLIGTTDPRSTHWEWSGHGQHQVLPGGQVDVESGGVLQSLIGHAGSDGKFVCLEKLVLYADIRENGRAMELAHQAHDSTRAINSRQFIMITFYSFGLKKEPWIAPQVVRHVSCRLRQGGIHHAVHY
jgi:hypothetical protein